MRREDVAAALREGHERDGYLRPDYNGYCFANVLPTAADLFDVDAGRTLPDDVFAGVDTDVSHVVVLLVDGFGFDRWRTDAGRYALFDVLDSRGTVTPLTSVYPSETGSAVPTLHTGCTPAEHGMLGWEWYDPEVGAVVKGLPFALKDDDRAAADVMDPVDLFAGDPVYDALAADGVGVHAVQPESIAGSATSEAMLGAAEDHPATNAAEMALTVRRTLESADGPTLCYAYFGKADALAHFAGTDSADHRAQLGAIADAVQRQLVERLDSETAAETLLLVTADHGLVDSDPGDYVDVCAVNGVADSLRTDPDGNRVPPVGSPRSVHLHLDGAADRVAAALDDCLDALVTTGEVALADGLFGPNLCERARRRAGDVVLSHRERTVWYDDEDHLGFVGNHGGLHPEEMLVPFAAARLDALR